MPGHVGTVYAATNAVFAGRYVFRLGRSRREREQIKLGLPARRPYPKRPDTEPTAT
ncbi:hypothetical protein [Streptomyces sp. LUP47B]|uniref:hypothetical protein n=1 Tax=Streptomyces sp. LUP47B TaxID=1890286 RepID=UPI00210EA57D|nr:hypothetical protein [Streptomyces sp. LUP47B]